MRVRYIVGLDALVLETFLQYDFMMIELILI